MTYVQSPAQQARRVCGERAYLHPQLVSAALDLAPGSTAIPEDVERHVRCTLQDHPGSEHYAYAMDLDGPANRAVWTSWTSGGRPATVVVLPDCDASDRFTGEPCCEYWGHPGAHTFELEDPWRASAQRASV